MCLHVTNSSHSIHTVCSADLDPLPFDCQEAYVLGCTRSGVYTIDPGCGKPFSAWCDMKNGGGWTVFQRRRDGSENFYRGWADYENGFGNIKGEHWLGLKKISCLTSVEVKTKLRIDLADFAGHSKFACYDHFRVGNPSSNYKLTIGGYQPWGLGTTRVPRQTSMDCTSTIRPTPMVSHGGISMLLHIAHAHFAIQT